MKFIKKEEMKQRRLNGNLFLPAVIILFIVDALMACISFLPGFNEDITKAFEPNFKTNEFMQYPEEVKKKQMQIADPLFYSWRNYSGLAISKL